jgi:DNA modification methylase
MQNIKDFKKETTTVWSFPERGNWATHNPKYRGNFAPQIARNIILRYSNEGDTVLDPMVGGGTTLIECKLLHRRGIGIDINPDAVNLTRQGLEFEGDFKYEQIAKLGDIRNLENINDNSVDLVLTHPPYANIIKYSKGEIESDLSNIGSIKKFCDELEKGIVEIFRVLKEGSYCAILIGDTRKSRHYVPISYYVMERFLKNGFILKEDIIKVQHNCQSTPYWEWKAEELNMFLIMHEHLFVFRKPRLDEDLSKFRYSRINT